MAMRDYLTELDSFVVNPLILVKVWTQTISQYSHFFYSKFKLSYALEVQWPSNCDSSIGYLKEF